VKKSGAWFTYEGEQLGQGREKAKEYLKQNPEVMMEISDKVLTVSGLKKSDDPEVADIADLAEEFTEADDAPIDLA
jgi:recombination protein RecA